jgi:two-component system, cell cycle response regulator CpdR
MSNRPDESDLPAACRDSERMLAGRKVLVVDDHFEVLEVIARVLGTAGCDVLTTETGLAAQAMLAQYDFDLLITDVVLADANGFELAAWARSLRPTLRLLYISGRDRERRRSPRPGQGVLLAKPFRLHQLVSSVERALIPGTVH